MIRSLLVNPLAALGVLVLGVALAAPLAAQTGPGGVGSTDGTSALELWLRADAGVTTGGGDVTAWADQSGNGLSTTSTSDPAFTASGANGMPTVTFDNGGATPEHLNLGQPAALDFVGQTDAFTLVGVFRFDTGGGTGGTVISKAFNGAAMRQWQQFVLNDQIRYNIGGINNTSVEMGAAGSHVIGTGVVSAAAMGLDSFFDGANDTVAGAIGTSSSATDVLVGARRDTTNGGFSFGWEGDISEIAVYSATLNSAERTLVENYLSAKYDIALDTAGGATDAYAGDTGGNGDHDLDAAGIGEEADGSNTEGRSAGLVLSESGGSLDTGEYVMGGHASATNGGSTADLPGGVESRMERIWYVDKTGTVDVVMGFDFTEAGVGVAPGTAADYVLLFRAGTAGAFTDLGLVAAVVSDEVQFTVPDATLVDGFYTLGSTDDAMAPVPVELQSFTID